MSDEIKDIELYKSIPTYRWWCYGCRNWRDAMRPGNDEQSKCYKCVGRYKKPYYDWEMRGLINNQPKPKQKENKHE